MRRPALAVVGPTCVGKTAVAVLVAGRLRPAELLNADSRQVRRGLRVGTCAPTAADLGDVRCHLLDLCDPGERFTVADWLPAARAALATLDERGILPVIVGGTGLYVTALLERFDLASVSPDGATRARRLAEATTLPGLAALADELRRRDPAGAATVDVRNPRRVVRALEILDARGGSLLEIRARGEPVPALRVGLDVPPDVHQQWIVRRTERMFQDGSLLGEVEWQLGAGVAAADLAGCGIGYAEAIDVIAGRIEVEAAIERTVRRTLRYAKAQRTYWRRDREMVWLSAGSASPAELAEQIIYRMLPEAVEAGR